MVFRGGFGSKIWTRYALIPASRNWYPAGALGARVDEIRSYSLKISLFYDVFSSGRGVSYCPLYVFALVLPFSSPDTNPKILDYNVLSKLFSV